jgi:dolichyl-phosphate-mannose-protein mannosyltransferase
MTDDKEFNEVTGYGSATFKGDTNDHWRIEVVDKSPTDPYLKAMARFRLVHQNTNRALFSHDVKLPEWGFGQQEVATASRGRRDLTWWRIDTNEHVLRMSFDVRLTLVDPSAPKTNYKKPGFIKKFIELHKVMWKTNAGLTGSHPYESRPMSWPKMVRGMGFWTKKDGGATQVFMLGNVLVWHAAFYCILVYVAYFLISMVLEKRQLRFRVIGMFSSRLIHHSSLTVCFTWCWFPIHGLGASLFPLLFDGQTGNLWLV